MKVYKTPIVVSYSGSEIIEVIGPTQTQAYMSVGGGWYSAQLNTHSVEHHQEGISAEVRLAQMGIKSIDTMKA